MNDVLVMRVADGVGNLLQDFEPGTDVELGAVFCEEMVELLRGRIEFENNGGAQLAGSGDLRPEYAGWLRRARV